MTGTYTKEALTAWLAGEGFTVVSFMGDGALWGYTSLEHREVGLWEGLRQFQVEPTLLHECLHVHRGDHGHQAQAVEDRIDEQVARLLVDPREYALAEERYGWHTGGIAVALDLPRWVIQAYRRHLQSTLQKYV